MIELWIILSIIIILILIFVIVAIINFSNTNDYLSKSEIIDVTKLQTGDIVGNSYNRIISKLQGIFSRSVWHHTGMIWVSPDTNKIFVLEAMNYKKKNIKGILKIPFDEWYDLNKKTTICYLKYIGKKYIDPNKLDTIFKKYQKCQLNEFELSWVRFLFKKDYFKNENKYKYTCNELTIQMLQDLEIVQKKYSCCSFFAKDIIFRNFDYCDNCEYNEAVNFIYKKNEEHF